MAKETLEVTLQYRRGDLWPVVAEHRRPGELPARSEGRLGLAPAFPDLDAFEVALTERLDRPRDYGTLLGEALFQGAVRDAFVTARSGAGDGLRVLLVVEDPRLRPLRWERLCAPDGLGDWDFLGLDQATPYSRYLPSLTDRRFPAIGRRDLRALVVLADPPTANPYELAPFDAGTSAASLAAALGEIPHDLLGPLAGALGPASLDALAERITAGGYTLLHLIAHGAVRADRETVLYLLDTTGGVAPVSASELIRRLGRVGAHRGLPHLVFLASCEGAKPEAEAALGGLAQRLVRDLGIPAVVAMTDRVSIATAGALAAAFYARLRARGEPDLALVEACAALQGRGDILVPALFGRLAGRPLFSDRLDGERPLTPAEIGLGLERLAALIAERAPVLTGPFEAQARVLRASLGTDTGALSPAARAERQAALDALDALAQEVLDLGFPALALDQPVPAWDGRCPFPGLKAFQRDEQAFFFGREALVGTLTRRLRSERFLAVLGASGSGKSSLVLAGVVPRFFGGEQRQHGDPRTFTPGADPEGALERALAAPLPADRDTLLVVDQLEELFTLCADPGRRARFVERLVAAWQANPRLYIVLTMRADFWGDCAPYPALKDRMQAHQELIAPMSTGELRGAMEQQAAAVGLRFEADLSHGILAEVEGEPGAMPLLQHLLLELWRRRHGRWLRASEYRALGGIREAIAHTADGIYAELAGDPTGQQLLRGLFVRLTRLDETESEPGQFRDTRQRVALAELTPAGSDPERVRALVQRLADARLVVTNTDPETGETQAEVSHEALIRHWPRLRGWLDEDRASWILLAAVRQQAQDWHANGERDADLPRWGERLLSAQTLFEQPRFAPTETEKRFVAAARNLDTREREERESQQRERLAALELAATEQRRKARIAWAGAGVAATLLAVALFLGFESNRAKNEAVRAQRVAEEQTLEARYQTAKVYFSNALAEREEEPLRAAHHFARAAEAFAKADRPGQAENARLALGYINDGPRLLAVLGHQGAVTSGSWSPDGLRVLTSSNDESAQVWDAATGEPTTRPMRHESAVWGAAFSPDQTRVLTWGWDGTARLWDAATGRPLGRPMEHAEPVYGATFDADGTRILTRSGDKTARLWDGHSGAPLGPPLSHDGPVRGALFSPDGARILTCSDDGTARVWNARTGLSIPTALNHGEPVEECRFNGDGDRVLTWSQNGGPRVWDADTGEELTRPQTVKLPIAGAEFNTGGTLALTWSPASKTARVRDAISGESIREIGHPAQILGGRLEENGSRVLTWDDGGTIRVVAVDVAAFRNPADLSLTHPFAINGARSSDNGARVLSWSGDGSQGRTGQSGGFGTARVWDGLSGLPLTPPLAHHASVLGGAFSPDGSRILTFGEDGTARIWDTSGDAFPRHADASASNGQGTAFSTEASPVEVRAEATGIRLYDAAGEPLSAPLALTPKGARQITDDGMTVVSPLEALPQAILSADRTLVLTWGKADEARRWDAKSGQELRPPLAHEDTMVGAQFSPDGARILTWSRDGSARVWDALSGAPVAPAMRHQAPVNGAQFSANASRVLTWSNDGSARIWDALSGADLSPPLTHGSQNFLTGSNAVMDARLSADESRVTTRDEAGTVRVWYLPRDTGWPLDALGLRLEAETGVGMSETGELHVLTPTEWRQVRYCEYDLTRHELGRIDAATWEESQRRCQAARSEGQSEASALHAPSLMDRARIRR